VTNLDLGRGQPRREIAQQQDRMRMIAFGDRPSPITDRHVARTASIAAAAIVRSCTEA